MKSKAEILEEFSLFSVPTGGIGSWLTEHTHDDVFERIGRLNEEPLSAVQLNQLLVLGHEAPVGDGFFRYYWLQTPEQHPYSVREVPGFSEDWLRSEAMIASLAHLNWGLYRLYIDALLYFGNVRTAFRKLRDLSIPEIADFFSCERFDTEAIKRRGPSLPLKPIAKDSRYLISEMACKSYGDSAGTDGDLRTVLLEAYEAHAAAGNPSPTILELLENQLPTASQARQQEFIYSADEVLGEKVSSEADLSAKYERVASKFAEARKAALDNTRYYLSMLSDLDVYVATSMRTRQDFRSMADTCDRIFADDRLTKMNLRYFDPTLSAAGGHEDKGLIECLMVKCAKLLVYCAGEKESYGKDGSSGDGSKPRQASHLLLRPGAASAILSGRSSAQSPDRVRDRSGGRRDGDGQPSGRDGADLPDLRESDGVLLGAVQARLPPPEGQAHGLGGPSPDERSAPCRDLLEPLPQGPRC